jgi:hypothetical protein
MSAEFSVAGDDARDISWLAAAKHRTLRNREIGAGRLSISFLPPESLIFKGFSAAASVRGWRMVEELWGRSQRRSAQPPLSMWIPVQLDARAGIEAECNKLLKRNKERCSPFLRGDPITKISQCSS